MTRATGSPSGGRLVGLLFDDSAGLAVAAIATLKADAGFLPINPAWPDERIILAFEECHVRLLIVGTNHRERALVLAERTRGGLRVVVVNSVGNALEPPLEDAAAACCDSISPETLAYVIYTSGSTGKPKGVPITHANLSYLMKWSRDAFQLGSHTKVAQNLSFAFDFGVFEVFTTLFWGGTMYFFDGDLSERLSSFGDFVTRHEINTLHTTPSFARTLLSLCDRLESLQIVHCGGEELDMASIRAIRDKGSLTCRIFNGYGPTETTINSALFEVPSVVDASGDAVPVGRPSAANTAYVLDRYMNLVPLGVPGELYIGGPGVSNGYIERPDLTAYRFVPDPFSSESGARLYRTGDLVKWSRSGELVYLGRTDEQVKIRGFRIELGEIETVIQSHPATVSCAVVAHEREGLSKQLVAYVVFKGGGSDDLDSLKSFLRTHLPSYMMPAVVVLSQLPLTSNGKVDRKALPKLTTRPERVAFQTPVENRVAVVWREVLGPIALDADSNFFDVGGDSLNATRVISRIRDHFSADVDVRMLFESPRLGDFSARVMEATLHTDGGADSNPTGPQPTTLESGPLTMAQEVWWSLRQFEHPGCTFNIPRAIRIRGALDDATLQRALAHVISHHDIFQTVYSEQSGVATQKVVPDISAMYEYRNIESLTEQRRVEESIRLATEWVRTPIDLTRESSLRALVIRLSGDEHVFVLSMHHIAVDAAAIDLVLREIVRCYLEMVRGESPSLETKPIRHLDFALWQRSQVDGGAFDEQFAYWEKRLAECPSLFRLESQRQTSLREPFGGAWVYSASDAELSRSVYDVAKTAHVTPFVVLASAFAVLLGEESQCHDLTFGAAVDCRPDARFEAVAGTFIHGHFLRARLERTTFRQLLDETMSEVLGSFQNKDVPVEAAAARMKEVEQVDQVLPPIFLTYVGASPPFDVPGLTFEPLPVFEGSSLFDVLLTLSEQDGRFTMSLTYRRELYSDGEMRRLLDNYVQVLRRVTLRVDEPLARTSV